MHHQKWFTDKNNRPKIEKLGIGKDKLMIKSTKVQAFVLLACKNSYSTTKTHTPIYTIFKPHHTCQTKLKTINKNEEERAPMVSPTKNAKPGEQIETGENSKPTIQKAQWKWKMEALRKVKRK